MMAANLLENTRTFAKKPDSYQAPLGAKVFAISSKAGIENGYVWGKQGKGTILLIHGWGSDSSTMQSFVNVFVKAGFRVATFDGPGHGANPGTKTTMMAFKNSIKDTISSLGDVVTVVAHSMGAIATIGAIKESDHSAKITSVCLLAPPATLKNVMERWSRNFLNINAKVMVEFNNELQKRNGVPATYWDIVALAKGMYVPILIVHDQSDQVVPVSDAEAVAKALPNVELKITNGGSLGQHLLVLVNKTSTSLIHDFVVKHHQPKHI